MLSDNNMYEVFCNAGYRPIDFENIDFKGKVKCIDSDGYIVYPTIRNVREQRSHLDSMQIILIQ